MYGCDLLRYRKDKSARKGRGMDEIRNENDVARTRSIRWMDNLWDSSVARTREEARKEEVLWVFRELVRDSESEKLAREYSPWERRWLS